MLCAEGKLSRIGEGGPGAGGGGGLQVRWSERPCEEVTLGPAGNQGTRFTRMGEKSTVTLEQDSRSCLLYTSDAADD